MNDISLKIVESPKSLGGVEASPTVETVVENEVDPLAIDDADLDKLKAVLAPVQEAVEEKAEGTAGNCDDNAKEKSISENQNGSSDNFVNVQIENVKEEIKEEKIPVAVVATPEPIKQPKDELKTVTKPVSVPEVVEKDKIVHKDVVIEPVAAVKLSNPVKVEPIAVEERKQEKGDVEMAEVLPLEEKVEPKVEKPKLQPMNGDIAKEEQGTKRRSSEEVDSESPLKKLCLEVEKTFPQHDTMITDYIQTATKNNIDELQRHTEQLLSEIQTLRELAQKKEHEWNNILHLKKVKEEILLRLLRRKQVISFEKADVNGSDRTDPFDYLNQAKNLAIDKSDEISGLALKQPGSTVTPMLHAPTQVMSVSSHFNPMSGLPPPYDKTAHMHSMPKPVFPQPMMMPGPLPGFPRDMNGQLPSSYGHPMGRQGPTKDVKSIIADYRQRNPDVTPRRGRRMKSILNPNMMNAPRPIAPKMDSLNNLNNFNMMFNNLDVNQKAMLERLQQMQAAGLPNGLSFKDVLVQFANMQQTNAGLIPNRPPETITNRPEHHIRPENRRRHPERNPHEDLHVTMKQAERLASPSPRLPPPPPYPEISLLPVTTSQETPSQQNSLLHGILTKNCGEITITPVQPTPPPQEPQPEKPEEVVQLDDEESPASEGETSGSPSGSGSGRLVIDEAVGEGPMEATEAEGPDDPPLCQGCRKQDAQFVCAGCANQWYCSRDCQVAAWDEHSEMCTG